MSVTFRKILRSVKGAVAVAAVLALVAPPLSAVAAAKTPADKYVRTANYYLRGGSDIRREDYEKLAKYDLVVMPVENQYYLPDIFPALRKANPNIVLLAYISSKSWNDQYWHDPVHDLLRRDIQDDWWLKDSRGQALSVWPGTRMLNPVKGWGDRLARFARETVQDAGVWDGIFYDEFSSNISWLNGGDVDLHGEGRKPDHALLDVGWRRSMENLLKKTRELVGPDFIVITNGDSASELQPFVNGRMFELFPTPWEAGGSWSAVTRNYWRLETQVGYSPILVINSSAGNRDNPTDYREMRFGLTSTLLGGGYFSFDYGDQNHGQLWWYDEYDVRLGKPVSRPLNLLNLAARGAEPGVWRRDFENGIALVNSTRAEQTVKFGQELERLRGLQDPAVNDGSVTESVTIPPQDGLILLKRISKLVGGAFPNGAFARFFDAAGGKVRNGFFAYEPLATGQATVLTIDLNGDGGQEKVVAGRSAVTIYGADGTKRAEFKPYGEAYAQGVNVAAADLDGDGRLEVITGTGRGAGPQVKIYNIDGRPLGPGFFAFDSRARGGVQVAAGDVNGDGKVEIICGAGYDAYPTARVFTSTGRLLTAFPAYGGGYRAGVRVAVGDLDGDGKAEIVTGAAPGGGPHVRIFSGMGRSWGKGFFAGDPSARNGVQVAVTDVNADGKAEIVALTTDVFQMTSTY